MIFSGKALGWTTGTLIWMPGAPGARRANVPSEKALLSQLWTFLGLRWTKGVLHTIIASWGEMERAVYATPVLAFYAVLAYGGFVCERIRVARWCRPMQPSATLCSRMNRFSHVFLGGCHSRRLQLYPPTGPLQTASLASGATISDGSAGRTENPVGFRVTTEL